MLQDLAARLADFLGEVDGEIAKFREPNALSCPPGCGGCCMAPTVETSPFEMTLIALELFRRGEAEFWHERLRQIPADTPERCVFYAPTSPDGKMGRCTMYGQRPTLCRLFGFAGRVDKENRTRLSICATMRDADPATMALALQQLDAGLDVPLFSEWRMRLLNFFSEGDTRLLPINEAARIAIERVGLLLQTLPDFERGDDDDDPTLDPGIAHFPVDTPGRIPA